MMDMKKWKDVLKNCLAFFERLYDSIKVTMKTLQWLKIAKITVCVMISALTVFYGATMLYKEEGTFTVGILPAAKEEEAKISLSETADFAMPVTVLGAEGVDEMTNISVKWLPDDLDQGEGARNGEHYICYSFYLKNTGDVSCNVTERFELDSSVKGADEAVRVRLYKNGVMTTYAKMGVNGQPEEGTIPFENDTLVFQGINEKIQTEETIKYTLVIWLEGDDPECLDNIRGGRVKMSMTFSADSTRER